MWYLAEILMAEPKRSGRRMYLCESCNVLFQAASAAEALRKANAWGRAYQDESPGGLRFLGVAHLSDVGEELGEGVDICGRFFLKNDVWGRTRNLIPPARELKAVRIERNSDTPLGEMMTEHQRRLLRRSYPNQGGGG